jgi:hypothetical protein
MGPPESDIEPTQGSPTQGSPSQGTPAQGTPAQSEVRLGAAYAATRVLAAAVGSAMVPSGTLEALARRLGASLEVGTLDAGVEEVAHLDLAPVFRQESVGVRHSAVGHQEPPTLESVSSENRRWGDVANVS